MFMLVPVIACLCPVKTSLIFPCFIYIQLSYKLRASSQDTTKKVFLQAGKYKHACGRKEHANDTLLQEGSKLGMINFSKANEIIKMCAIHYVRKCLYERYIVAVTINMSIMKILYSFSRVHC